MTINERVDKLREEMKKHDIQAVIIPSNDPHQSEYVADRWKSREWISGFTGSAGTALVALDHCGVWTDGRYYLQAEEQLSDSYFELHKFGRVGDKSHIDWIVENVEKGGRVSIAGEVCAMAVFEAVKNTLASHDIELVVEHDLIDAVWTYRAAIPTNEIFTVDARYTGETREQKLTRIRAKMSTLGSDYHLVSTLDDIAWIFNIRGKDVEFNPVAVAYALIGQDDAYIYILDEKVPHSIKGELEAQRIFCKAYSALANDLASLDADKTILVDSNMCNVILYNKINANIKRGKTLPRAMKAIKNDTEIAHSKASHIKDAVALAKTFYWLDQLLKEGKTCQESDFAQKLIEHRSENELYFGESFPAIIGYKSNGAIIHYRPMPGEDAEIKADGILLADSGGQYTDGTTDVTRTIALGAPSAEEKRNYTLVLKGHIELARAKFPKGTTGGQLDTLARMHLWSHGLNYNHGTGHGVGFFLNVHEPPQGFAPPPSERASTIHELGMFSSNEPGYYKTGAYGIRLENLVFTVASKDEGFYELDTVTLYPFDLKLIDETLLSSSEKAWLNQYHHEVFSKVSPLIQDEGLKTWFKLKCRGLN